MLLSLTIFVLTLSTTTLVIGSVVALSWAVQHRKEERSRAPRALDSRPYSATEPVVIDVDETIRESRP
jgi:hypothetical protein